MKPKASEGEKPKWSDTTAGYHFSNIKKKKIMKKFKVTVTETLTKEFFVDAEIKADALDEVMKRYTNYTDDEVLLTRADFDGTTFKAEEL